MINDGGGTLIGNKHRENMKGCFCVALWMRFTGMAAGGYRGNSRGWSFNGVDIGL